LFDICCPTLKGLSRSLALEQPEEKTLSPPVPQIRWGGGLSYMGFYCVAFNKLLRWGYDC